jgi:hypothetical protein
MAKKPNLAWVDAVGERIRRRLIDRQGRQFDFHQSGPYTQSKQLGVAIHFNENESGKPLSRFGYYLGSWLSEPGDAGSRRLTAGFDLFHVSATVALTRVLPNFQANLIAYRRNLRIGSRIKRIHGFVLPSETRVLSNWNI